MTTVQGLFGAGDTIGGSAHKFSAGSFVEGRLAGKAAVRYVMDMKSDTPRVDDDHIRGLRETVFKPLENYRVGRNEIVAGTVAPSYINPLQGLQRLENWTSMRWLRMSSMSPASRCLTAGWSCSKMLTEDFEHIGATVCINCRGHGELQHRS
jgi:adenylylsulfate reductase subunit A